MKRFFSFAIATVLSVCSFAQDLTSYVNDAYVGNVMVEINGAVTGPVNANVTIVKDASGDKIQFVLKNFILPNEDDPESPMYVGNIKLEDVVLGMDKENGFVTMQYEKGTTIEDGDMADVPFWAGPMLGELPIILKGIVKNDFIDIDIDINAEETLGQIIHVDFYTGNDTSYEGTLSSTINGMPTAPTTGTATVYQHMNNEIDIVLNDYSLDVPFTGVQNFGDIILRGITVTNGAFNKELSWNGFPITISGTISDTSLSIVCNIDASIMGMKVQTTFTSNSSTKLGDANKDGEVNNADAKAVVDKFLGKDVDPFDSEAADVNKDSKISVSDANAIINMNNNQ